MRILIIALALLSGSAVAGTPTAEWTALGFNGRGCDGAVTASVELADGSVILGGLFTACDDVDAVGLVHFDPQTGLFSAAPSGLLRGSVNDLTRQGNTLFVAGLAMQMPGITGTWGFAQLQLDSGLWSTPVSSLEDNQVRVIADVAGEIYIAPEFGSNALLRFDPATSMTATILSQSTTILALEADAGQLLVGGAFTQIGGVSASRFAQYDPLLGSWSSLGASLNNTVYTIASDADAIYVGGDFSMVNGQPTDRVARFDRLGASWQALGTGNFGSGSVRDLAVSADDLIAVGDFTAIDGAAAINIARYDGSTQNWIAINGGNSIGGGGAYFVRLHAGQVYVGGLFVQAGGESQSQVARFLVATEQWLAMGAGVVTGANATVFDILPIQGGPTLLMGSFSEIGGIAADRIAQIDCDSLQISPLGNVADHQINGAINGAAQHQGWLYIGGSFTAVAGMPAAYLARYHLATGLWEALPGSPDNLVEELYVDGDELYVSGFFSAAGGMPARGVARLNLTTLQWQTLGSGPQNGTDGVVYAFERVGDRIYVGGLFDLAGGETAGGFAIYLPASDAWLSPGAQFENAVWTMKEVDGGLYVGGIFQFLNGELSRGLARLDLATGAWSTPAGPGQPGLNSVDSLLERNGQLLVGGIFTSMGGIPINSIGLLDPTTQEWAALGQGVELSGPWAFPSATGFVSDTAVCRDQIIVAGFFQRADGQTSTNLAFLKPPGPIFLDDFE